MLGRARIVRARPNGSDLVVNGVEQIVCLHEDEDDERDADEEHEQADGHP